MKDLSVIIVTWNGKEHVERCLEALRIYLSSDGVEIIVVDNASRDGTLETIERRYPTVVLIRNETNVGFARANNIGMMKASGKYLALINSDVRVLPNCLEELVAFMERNPDIGLLGPKMLDMNGLPQRSCMGTPTLWRLLCRACAVDTLFPRCKALSGLLMTYIDRRGIADVDVVNGCFWLVRAEALVKTGMFDERFFMYGEDIDWCMRFHKNGWRVVYYPAATAIHYGGGSSSRAPIRFYLEKQKANLQYWQKYHGKISRGLYRCVVTAEQCLRIIGYGAQYVMRPSIRAEAVYKVKRSAACVFWLMGVKHQGQLER